MLISERNSAVEAGKYEGIHEGVKILDSFS